MHVRSQQMATHRLELCWVLKFNLISDPEVTKNFTVKDKKTSEHERRKTSQSFCVLPMTKTSNLKGTISRFCESEVCVKKLQSQALVEKQQLSNANKHLPLVLGNF